MKSKLIRKRFTERVVYLSFTNRKDCSLFWGSPPACQLPSPVHLSPHTDSLTCPAPPPAPSRSSAVSPGPAAPGGPAPGPGARRRNADQPEGPRLV